jgi:hypothetical protein
VELTPAHFEALKAAEGQAPTAAFLERLAKQFDPELARWATMQWELRKRAEAKFAKAHEMLFTREALEQASHEQIAAHRARHFPEGKLVADWTCSIGADLIALAKRGPAIGIDLDPERLAYAKHNLAVHGLEAELILGDCLQVAPQTEFAVADPARRIDGRRTVAMDQFQPDPQILAERFSALRNACLKLSPMMRDEDLLSLGGRLELWSYGRECREAAVWLGLEAGHGRYAVHVESGERLSAASSDTTLSQPSFFFEADPAAIRAHALGALAERFDLDLLGDSNGYLTGPKLVRSVWLRSYEVIEICSHAKLPAVQQTLKKLEARVDAVKSRTRGIEPAEVIKKLRPEGDRRLIAAAVPFGKSHQWWLLEER